MNAAELLARCPVVPVVVLDDVAQAVPLGRALLAGGIDVVEVTLRTAAGLDGIRALSALPGLVVGAGSVLLPDQVDRVVAAGARFVVSPGVSRAVLARAAEHGVPALPGVATATDLMAATELGLTDVKFFPAGLLGGPDAIRALAAPFGGVSFLPSGGVSPETMADYLALPEVPAVSGSWMAAPALLRDARWDAVTERSATAIATARGRPERPAPR
ncbi:bifunctional 4-hydroxy-2-oxoglutarate aldolase/2-dehydro-3-deoxy-phosphogluconate aldolase [Saccharopolyspora rosea]|uniref:2-dehydro-3-deoxy-phosphogluconate aldolase n=1 Tax=Saccharopolyspora rosea TaxID=524884 RepID=A0ABW3FTL8_9PSEU|nr:bifunctional 4-hydroxy-2-oxoglutarate aldolase/2-dehydro-3-deoxy-phosphogluconate aldolase [Saccharopolyspora rosea]